MGIAKKWLITECLCGIFNYGSTVEMFFYTGCKFFYYETSTYENITYTINSLNLQFPNVFILALIAPGTMFIGVKLSHN